MSSTLVSYSSGEEDEDKGKRHADANYDDVQMDMSDDNDNEGASEANMFSSKEEYKAYQKQFNSSNHSSSVTKNSDHTRSATEYGSGVSASSSDRQPRRSENNSHHQSSTSRKVEDSGDEQSRNHKDRRRGDHDGDSRRRRRDHHRRDRSRSRSRERGQHHRRRSRSRDRDDHRHRERRQSRDNDDSRSRGFPPPQRKSNNSEQDRQDSRSRKLQSLGLLNKPGETLAEQMEKVKEMTGVEVPKYYNPAAINPLRYAEQIKKRQMLWKKSGTETDKEQPGPGSSLPPATLTAAAALNKQLTPDKQFGGSGGGPGRPPPPHQPVAASSFNQWETTNFGNDKTNEKFRRLMGIKSGSCAVPPPSSETPSSVQKGSAKLFEMQEQQYEKARAITHTARGLGLGFTPTAAPAATPSTSALPPPPPGPPSSSFEKQRDTAVSFLKK